MSGLGEVISRSKVHGDQESLELWAMIDLDSLERFELLFPPLNFVWFRCQNFIVSDHLLKAGCHTSINQLLTAISN